MRPAGPATAPARPREPLLLRWRYEVRAALICAAAVAAAGVVSAAVWAWLAPPQQLLVVRVDRGIPLTGEDQHPFDGVALFACITASMGVIAAITVWRWRRARGPILVAGLLLGSGLSAAVACALCGQFALWHYPRAQDPALRSIVTAAPQLATWAVIVVQPLAAGLVMVFAAALSPWDDLGVSEAMDAAGETAPSPGPPPPPAALLWQPAEVVGAFSPEGAAPQTRLSP